MSGVAWRDLPVGAEGLFVQDRDLFPEGAFRRHRAERGAGSFKYMRILLGGEGRDRGFLRRRPGGQSPDL